MWSPIYPIKLFKVWLWIIFWECNRVVMA